MLLIYVMVNIKTVLPEKLQRHKSSMIIAPLSIMLCYSATHTSNRCCLKLIKSCALYGRLAPGDFVMKCTEHIGVRQQQVWKFYGCLSFLHFVI